MFLTFRKVSFNIYLFVKPFLSLPCIAHTSFHSYQKCLPLVQAYQNPTSPSSFCSSSIS